MEEIIPTNKSNDGFVKTLRLMLGASSKVDSVAWYFERPVNKLVMWIEDDEPWDRFPDRKLKVSRCLEHLDGSYMSRMWTCLKTRYSLRDYRNVLIFFWFWFRKNILKLFLSFDLNNKTCLRVNWLIIALENCTKFNDYVLIIYLVNKIISDHKVVSQNMSCNNISYTDFSLILPADLHK